jgi:hypothetical protein
MLLHRTKVLVLNSSYEPLSICDAQKAILLLFGGKAVQLSPAEYCSTDLFCKGTLQKNYTEPEEHSHQRQFPVSVLRENRSPLNH